MRSFGPIVRQTEGCDDFHASCDWCMFRTYRNGSQMCRYVDPLREIPDPANTPEWCSMREGSLRDARDMAAGIEHKVFRWSGRRTDDPRVIFCGIPSEASRQFRLAVRSVKRGTVRLTDEHGEELARFPEAAS